MEKLVLLDGYSLMYRAYHALQSPMSAPSKYAVDSHCLFAARDVDGLASVIDWWAEHPEALAPVRELYLEEAKSLRIRRSADAFERMAKQAVADDELAYRLRGSEVVVGGASTLALSSDMASGMAAMALSGSRVRGVQ